MKKEFLILAGLSLVIVCSYRLRSKSVVAMPKIVVQKAKPLYDDVLHQAISKSDLKGVEDALKKPLSITRIEVAIRHALDIRNLLFRSEKKGLFEKSEKIHNVLRKANKLLVAVEAGDIDTVKKLLERAELNQEDKNTLTGVASKEANYWMRKKSLWMPSPTTRTKTGAIIKPTTKQDMDKKIAVYKEIITLLGGDPTLLGPAMLPKRIS